MNRDIRAPIPLSAQQITELRRVSLNGEANFPQAYALVHGWIKDNPAAQQDGTVFWFAQAQGINRGTSLSSHFIRRHTENGLDYEGVPHSERLGMQEMSDLIAQRVIGDILGKGHVPALAYILKKDIDVALDDGKASVACMSRVCALGTHALFDFFVTACVATPHTLHLA